MKKSIQLLCFLPLISSFLHGQNCNGSQNTLIMNSNNIDARTGNGGEIFYSNGSRPSFLLNSGIGTTQLGTIFQAGLWFGGLDNTGGVHTSTALYRQGGVDYFPGPIINGTTTAADCARWDLVFEVYGFEVRALINNGNVSNSVLYWPAKGNIYIGGRYPNLANLPNQDLAPFFDQNNDGIYNPYDRDYPIIDASMPNVIPTEMSWSIFNDIGNTHTESDGLSSGIEVQFLTYSFSSSDSVLNNTIFTKHKITKKTGVDLVDTRLGIWIDFDLGCENDDYLGCSPGFNTFYVYNADTNDQPTGCSLNGFGTTIPVQTVTLLDQSLDGHSYYVNNNSTYGNPTTAAEHYNYLKNTFRDGTAMHASGSGHLTTGPVTNYAFPDNPSNTAGWSMTTGAVIPTDMRSIGTHNIGNFNLNQTFEISAAWSLHENPNSIAPWDFVNPSMFACRRIQNLFLSKFGTSTGVSNPIEENSQISVFPNPTNNELTVDGEIGIMDIFDIQGRNVQSNQRTSKITTTDISSLGSGLYFLRITNDKNQVSTIRFIKN
jgi:Secretion system C-terminal sorting domain